VWWWGSVVASAVAAGDQIPRDSRCDGTGVGTRVGDVAGQLVSVDDGVVSPAQQREVGEVGCPAVGPMDQVVSVAPVGGSRAAGETAPPVP
jgi:hypothetical protein